MTRGFYIRAAMAAALAGGMWLGLPWLKHQIALKIVASRAADTPLRVGGVAPDFLLESSAGTRVQLSDFKGKVVLLNFWATWCGPCKTEIPWFLDFQKELGPRGLSVVGIAMDDDGWRAVRPFVMEHKIGYPVLLGEEAVTAAYGDVEALPTTFLIGRDGKLAYVHQGLVDREQYRSELLALLKK